MDTSRSVTNNIGQAGSLNRVAVVGLGYVGLPLALAFSRSGCSVVGIDTDPDKITQIDSGKSYLRHIASASVQNAVASRMFFATTDISQVSQVDAVIICVPTPLTPQHTPDLSFVLNTATAIAPRLPKGVLVVLESTTYPGTTSVDLRKCLEEGSGLTAGRDFHLAFSPEREDPGNPTSLERIPKVVGGLTPACLSRAVSLYSKVVPRVVEVSSCDAAEATKLLENIFRSVNIALVNELKVIYSSMGIDVWEVIAAASTKPFGFMPFYPGPGLGGHCIPIDPFYLSWKAKEFGHTARFIELAGEINTAMPQRVVKHISEALNDLRKPLRSSRILLLGLAYKKNVDDDRESPTYAIWRMLLEAGADVSYNDPYVPMVRPGRTHGGFAGIASTPISDDFDAIVVCTDHDIYRVHDFTSYRGVVIDTRNAVAQRPQHYRKA
jgi:UDP-N-acetyl-D-glucosamine dehydrogenase